MAIRYNASADELIRTTNLPTITAFTMMGWFYISVDQNAFTAFMVLGDTTGFEYYFVGTSSDGTTLLAYPGRFSGTTGTNLTVGTWNHIAMTVAGTGVGDVLVYLNGVLDITEDGFTGVAAQAMYVGNDSVPEPLDGRSAAVKIYDAVLSLTEIQAEMWSILPRRITGLNGHYPMFGGSDAERARDYSGNGNNWTVNGTLTDEAGPLVTWGLASYSIPFVVAAVVGVEMPYPSMRHPMRNPILRL